MHRVNEIMSQDVVRIAPTDSIRHAAELMARYDIGALPVCDNNRLVGMVTDRDLAVRAVSAGKPPDTGGVTRIEPDTPPGTHDDGPWQEKREQDEGGR
ncbi:Hypoxic response protein 1 [Burkholderia multivorans]|nr:Hypoxic response protein 1 [Burkholderia multivorans]